MEEEGEAGGDASTEKKITTGKVQDPTPCAKINMNIVEVPHDDSADDNESDSDISDSSTESETELSNLSDMIAMNVFNKDDKSRLRRNIRSSLVENRKITSTINNLSGKSQMESLKCICGILSSRCCELRRELKSALRQLSEKYPHLLQDIDQILYCNNAKNYAVKAPPRFPRAKKNYFNAENKNGQCILSQNSARRTTTYQAQGQDLKNVKSENKKRQFFIKNKQLNNDNDKNKNSRRTVGQNSAKITKTNQGQGQDLKNTKFENKKRPLWAKIDNDNDNNKSENNAKNNNVTSKRAGGRRIRRRRRGGNDGKIGNKKSNKVNIQTVQKSPPFDKDSGILVKYINDMIKEYNPVDYEINMDLHYEADHNLNDYANYLVNAGFGRIVEAPIHINRNKNHQAFVEISTDRETTERDGIILNLIARQYALDGDIVRAFVLHGNPPEAPAASTVGGPVTTTTTTAKKITKINMKLNKMSLHDDDHADDVDVVIEEKEEEDDELDDDGDVDELDDIFNVIAYNLPKAFVIKIIQQNDRLDIVGHINFLNFIKIFEYGPLKKFLKFHPIDTRMPIIYIEANEPELLKDKNKLNQHYLYTCKIWFTDEFGYCFGKLQETIGLSGELSSEIKAILLHNGLKHIRPYEERFNELNAKDLEVQMEVTETQTGIKREDLTKKCIFTIDPKSARDLDDALSIEEISENVYEVGVHISDVSQYVTENSELDNIVKDRCNSIYMVNEVIHMLPEPLCLHCSLLPDQNKYAFSVFWRFNSDGKLLIENDQAPARFTRSIIRSCGQLAYEHAQYIIDNAEMSPEQIEEAQVLPNIGNGFKSIDIVNRVRRLHKLAIVLRKERFDAGALTIKNPKVLFHFDEDTREPIGYEVEKRQEANFMIEEFMLLANQAVAKFIYAQYPEIAILRNHPPPLLKCMENLSGLLAKLGINIDYSTSKSIQESIERNCRESEDPNAMNIYLSTLLTKPMARAKYFCSEGKVDNDLRHYALSIPIYTHFTSPIRRYPDILVHRLLAAALNYCEAPKRTVDELHEIVKVCNETKYNAKNAGDESIKLYFKRYLQLKSEIVVRCVVIEICSHLMNVAIIETGQVVPIIYRYSKLAIDTSEVPKCVTIMLKNSKKERICLQVTATLDVRLKVTNNSIRGYFVSPDP